MFKIRTSEPGFLKDVLDSISDLVTEGTFEIDKSGIRLVAMDPAGAAMVVMNLYDSAFDSFESKQTEITVNLEMLLKVLKRARTNDILVMELLEEENKLKIMFQGDSVRSFLLPLIEPLESRQRVRKMEFSCNMNIDPKLFKDSVNDAAMVSESVTLQVSEKGFEMNSEGDSRNFRMFMDKDTKGFFMEGKARARYGIDYLEKMLKPTSFSDNLKISFSSDYPLQLEYKSKDKFEITFILAPRMELD